MPLFGGSRTVAVGLVLNPRGVVTGAAVAAKAVKDYADAADKSLGKHKRNWDDIGDAAAKAGLVIGAGVAAAVVKFAQFDKSMSRAAAGTQATAVEMRQLREAAIQAGQDTQYSATEAADAITEMGKAGVSVRDILGGGLAGTLDLAAAGELEVADAAEIAATALTQFGLKGSDLPHVADLLAAGAGKAQGSVQDLGYALKYVGPVARSANVSIEETVGTIAELASQGIIGEQAGTSLRGMLQSLRGPSEKSAKTMDALGISLYDADGRFIGLAGAAEQLHSKIAPLPEAQRDAALATIFGNEQVTAATILMRGGAAAVEEWTNKVNEQGYAAKQAGQLMDNLSGDVEQLKGSLETALISSGSGANDGLRALTQAATGAVNAFSALPDGVQKSTVVVAGLTAGAALLTAGVIKGAIAVRTMRTNLDELGISGTRAGRAMGLVGRAAAGLGAAALAVGASHDLAKQLDVVGEASERMQLELTNYAKGADLAGESARLFGSNLKGQRSWTNLISQDLRTVVNDLSGVNGWWRKDIPIVGSDEADQIKELGKALAGLAQSGHADTAAQAFDRLSKSAGLNEEEAKRLLQLMPEYDAVLSHVAAEQVSTGDAAAGAADSMTVLKQSMAQAATKAKDLQEELKGARDAAKDLNEVFLDSRSAARDYEQALDDAAEIGTKRAQAAKDVAEAQRDLRTAKTKEQREAAAKALRSAQEEAASYARTLDNESEAGRRNQAALDAIATAGQRRADGILAQTGSDEQYRASLEESRKDLQLVAEQFGMTEQAAKTYVDEVLRIPAKVSTQVELGGVEQASDRLVAIRKQLWETQGILAPQNAGEKGAGLGVLRTPTPRPAQKRDWQPRAVGGPVRAGRDYLVGERRPEIFRPSLDGFVFPSAGAAKAAPTPVVTVPVQTQRSNSVNLNGPITVMANNPSQFTDWGATQARFGAGGVG